MTYKPVLIEISVEELIRHIRIKADSTGEGLGPKCNLSITDESACGPWADGNDGPGNAHLQMCLDIGPLFGCNEHEDFYCSTIISPIV